MIQNILVRFRTYAAFKAALDAGNISNSSIVFIADRRVIYHNGVEYGVDKSVDITDIDTLNKLSDCGDYIVLDDEHVVGYMTIISDSMNHLVTQIFTSHYVYNTTDGNWTAESEFVLQDDGHNDNTLSCFYRSYRLSTSGTATWAVNTWSNWKPCNDFYMKIVTSALESAYGEITDINTKFENTIVSTNEVDYDPTSTKTTIDDIHARLDNLDTQVATVAQKVDVTSAKLDATTAGSITNTEQQQQAYQFSR